MENKIKKHISKFIKVAILAIILCLIIASSYYFFSIKFNSVVYQDDTSLLKNEIEVVSVKKEIVESKNIQDDNLDRDNKIAELQNKISELELKISNVNLQNELSIIAISFSKLLYLVQMDLDHEMQLSQLASLSIKDHYLTLKIEKLKDFLAKKNYNIAQMPESFAKLIDNLVSLKKQDDVKMDFFDNIKNNLSQLIVIRRIDGRIVKDGDEIDAKILEIARFIKLKSYSEALETINSLESKYQESLSKVTLMLENQIAINNSFKEIFLYLQKIINNV